MSISEAPGRGRAMLGLLLTTVLVPLAFLALGAWEWQRASAHQDALALQRDRIAKVVAILETRAALAGGSLDTGARFHRGGQTYVGPLAVAKARETLDEADSALVMSGIRRYLPPIVVLSAGLSAGLSVLALLAAALLGRAGRGSREALARGFTVARLALAPLLALQVLLAATCVVAAIAFEASAILEAGDLSSGGVKLLAIAAVVIGASLWTAGKAVAQLRRTVAIFTPDPLPIAGRPVSREEAPGLWRLLDDLAARLGALRPDNVVVGLTGGVFVSSGPKVLEPGGTPLEGRTLYLPLPLLPLLREDEVATIIGHELAHFSGGDTEYSLRFLPIYAGVGRSLDAVLMAGAKRDGSVSLLTRPALRLGVFVMDQFHLAVRHWSRLREFAADAAGAEVTSADAAARALLRTTAAQPRIDETLEAAYRAPESAPPDLVAATLDRVAEQGLDSPAEHLEERQPHPTDTHPTTRQRLDALGGIAIQHREAAGEGFFVPGAPVDAADAGGIGEEIGAPGAEKTRQPPPQAEWRSALGREVAPALLAAAAAAPPPDAASRLSAYFADPGSLCRTATDDFLAAAREDAQASREALEAAATGIGAEVMALHENSRGGGLFLIGCGGILALVALVLVAIGLPKAEGAEAWIAVAGGGALGLIFMASGVGMLRRGDKPFLILRPEAMAIAGLDRPIAWEHALELDMTMDRGRIVTRILLPPGAPFPARLPGGRRVKLDPKRRSVTFAAGLPRGLKAQGFADLVWRYRQAAMARQILAGKGAAGDAR